MQLQTVLNHLKTGEFSLSNLGGNDEEGVTSNNIETIINHINIGLINLYTKFNLHMGELHLQQYAQIQKYKIHSKFAKSNSDSTATVKYIIDTEAEPFKDNILLITNVYDEEGCELPLNDSAYSNSIYTPSYNVIQVPCPEDENAIVILYRAGPELLELDGCNVNQEVPIPMNLLEALLYFVAYRVKASRPDVESLNESNNYYAKFEAMCNSTTLQGLYNTSSRTNTKLEDRGFR